MRKRKAFDSVGFMRAIRDRMSQEMKGMTSEEQIEYIRRKSGVSVRKRAKTAARSTA